jgi:hypothetical protein
LQYFTLDQMHFLTFEALLEQPLDALNGIATFLGRPLFEATHEPIHSNETRMPLSRRSLWVVGEALGYDHYLYKLTSSLTI